MKIANLFGEKFVLLVILGLVTPPAYAYVDPSSSLLVLQGALAALGALVMFVKHPIRALKKLISRVLGRKDA